MYLEGGILGFCTGILGILIHYLVISYCVGKTITYGDYLGSFQLIDQNRSPLQKKVTIVYNIFHIIEAIIAFCILRIENVTQLDNYEYICGFICGFLGLLIISGIVLIFAPKEETAEENEIAEACFRAMKQLKKGASLDEIYIPEELIRLKTYKKIPGYNRDVIQTEYSMSLMYLWFFKSLYTKNTDDMRFIMEANKGLVSNKILMDNAMNGARSNIKHYYDMFLFYSLYEDFEHDTYYPFKARMFYLLFRDMKISKKYKDFKYNYHMALYCYRFTHDKNPEETLSYLTKAEEQIQKKRVTCNYAKAEIDLFKWLISDLRYKI